MELKDEYEKFCDVDIDDPICEDRWQELMKKSKTLLTKRLVNNSTTTFTVLSTSVVQVIFTITQILKQPSDVRYLAVEIFDRFTSFHYAQLYEYVKKDIKTDSSKTNMRDRVCQRIETQILLRIMSCIQLASKMNSNIEFVSPATISDFLKKMKQPFSLHSIMKSERRVLKTIKFKLGVSVLTYVEHLLLLLAQHNSKIDLEVMYTTIIQVVDITYLLHEEIYLLLFNKMTGRWEKSAEEKKQFLEVECNYVYLSAAIIECAAHILNWHDSQFTSVLQELTQVPARDIDGLTTIINKVILS